MHACVQVHMCMCASPCESMCVSPCVHVCESMCTSACVRFHVCKCASPCVRVHGCMHTERASVYLGVSIRACISACKQLPKAVQKAGSVGNSLGTHLNACQLGWGTGSLCDELNCTVTCRSIPSRNRRKTRMPASKTSAQGTLVYLKVLSQITSAW